MIRDHAERRAYRKSPGRQYGYEYDPLRSQIISGYRETGRLDTPVQNDSWTTGEENGSRNSRRTSGPLAPRPNPRRTRQLLRQNILASKARSGTLEDTGPLDPELQNRRVFPDEDQERYPSQPDSTLYSNRRARPLRTYTPARERYSDAYEGLVESAWEEEGLEYMDPDLGIEEDPLAQRLVHSESLRSKSAGRGVQDDYTPETYEREKRRSAPLEYDEDAYADEIVQQPTRRGEKKKHVSRRKLLFGALAVGGTALAAYELVPRIPSALENAGTNIEHQLQDAFNRGVAAGSKAVRKDLINSLDTLEGVSLEGAIGAAKLTRTAYDVFVSPIVTLAATVAGDFLSVTSLALQTGRGWLNRINYGSATLDALQSVVDSWVKQAHNMPQKWQTATATDLDGATAYLRALQKKIQDEQAKLNGQTTPTPKPTSTPKR